MKSKNDQFTFNFDKYLSDMIIWHRKKSKMSQCDLALISGVSRSALQRLENGALTIQLDNLLKILQALNIKIEFEGPLVAVFERELNHAN